MEFKKCFSVSFLLRNFFNHKLFFFILITLITSRDGKYVHMKCFINNNSDVNEAMSIIPICNVNNSNM